jgi:hypothetical protein
MKRRTTECVREFRWISLAAVLVGTCPSGACGFNDLSRACGAFCADGMGSHYVTTWRPKDPNLQEGETILLTWTPESGTDMRPCVRSADAAAAVWASTAPWVASVSAQDTCCYQAAYCAWLRAESVGEAEVSISLTNGAGESTRVFVLRAQQNVRRP